MPQGSISADEKRKLLDELTSDIERRVDEAFGFSAAQAARRIFECTGDFKCSKKFTCSENFSAVVEAPVLTSP